MTLVVAYGVVAAFVFLCGLCVALTTSDYPEDRRTAARVALCAPVWPVALVVWLIVVAFRK